MCPNKSKIHYQMRLCLGVNQVTALFHQLWPPAGFVAGLPMHPWLISGSSWPVLIGTIGRTSQLERSVKETKVHIWNNSRVIRRQVVNKSWVKYEWGRSRESDNYGGEPGRQGEFTVETVLFGKINQVLEVWWRWQEQGHQSHTLS